MSARKHAELAVREAGSARGRQRAKQAAREAASEAVRMGQTGSSKARGVGVNLTELCGGIRLNVVNQSSGPFTEPAAGAAVQEVLATDLWKDQRTVVHVMRRFGCPLCRNAAAEIASIKPILDRHNVRLVGVGLGYNSLDGFVESGVWKGLDLYVDVGKKMYAALGLGQGGLRMLLDKEVRAKNAQANARGVGGNLSGDGMQLGGEYVVAKGGQVLYEYQQRNFGDHSSPSDLLKALGLEAEIPNIPKQDPKVAEACRSKQECQS